MKIQKIEKAVLCKMNNFYYVILRNGFVSVGTLSECLTLLDIEKRIVERKHTFVERKLQIIFKNYD